MQPVRRELQRDQGFILQVIEGLGLPDLGLNAFSHIMNIVVITIIVK
jgi:hypothetical protein